MPWQAHSQGVRGVRRTTPNLPKGRLFATKWAKNGVLWGGLGPKGPLSGVPHPPNIESGYGSAPWEWGWFIQIFSLVFVELGKLVRATRRDSVQWLQGNAHILYIFFFKYIFVLVVNLKHIMVLALLKLKTETKKKKPQKMKTRWYPHPTHMDRIQIQITNSFGSNTTIYSI